MLGFAPISTLPLDTLPQAQAISGTAEFTESGEALLATGTVGSPARVAMGGGVNWRQMAAARAEPKKPETVKEKKKAVERKQEKRTATARFSVSPNPFRASGYVLNRVAGSARFTQGKTRFRAAGEVQAITDDDLVEFSQLIDELVDA